MVDRKEIESFLPRCKRRVAPGDSPFNLVWIEGFEPTHHYRTDLQSAAILQLDSIHIIYKALFRMLILKYTICGNFIPYQFNVF